MQHFTVSIPKVDLKRFKGLIKAMGWTFEQEMDETEYIMSQPKIMDAISKGDEAIASGNYTTTRLEEIWNQSFSPRLRLYGEQCTQIK